MAVMIQSLTILLMTTVTVKLSYDFVPQCFQDKLIVKSNFYNRFCLSNKSNLSLAYITVLIKFSYDFTA